MKLLVALAAVYFLTYGHNAHADPRYQASVQGVVITLHSEKCAIAEVSNLPYRATWMENGKTYEGCFGVVWPLEMVMFYFLGDRTVAVVPTAMFRAVQGV